jgi:hypothetical protein
MKSLRLKHAFLISLTGILVITCSKEEPYAFFKYPLPDQIDPEVAARLTQRFETENYIFYYADGDTIEFDRCESYAKWGLDYLGVILPKKIEFFKFRSFEEMEEALSRVSGGRAFPDEVAYATCWEWHNHECMHILAHFWASQNYPPSFFIEGMAVAHEFDPYNDGWISRWNRAWIDEPFIDIVKKLKTEGKLSPLSGIMESQAFLSFRKNEGDLVAYPQAGVFIAYLIKTYGLEKFREVYSTLNYEDTLPVIQNQFATTYKVSLEKLEQDWLTSLETTSR